MLGLLRSNCGNRSASIEDPAVRQLADGIVETQRKEIAEMQALIKDLDQ